MSKFIHIKDKIKNKEYYINTDYIVDVCLEDLQKDNLIKIFINDSAGYLDKVIFADGSVLPKLRQELGVVDIL